MCFSLNGIICFQFFLRALGLQPEQRTLVKNLDPLYDITKVRFEPNSTKLVNYTAT